MSAPALAAPRDRSAVRAPTTSSKRDVVLVAGWVVLLVVARLVGLAYVDGHRTPVNVDAVPWSGWWEWSPDLLVRDALVAAALGAIVWALPRIVVERGWRLVLAATGATAAVTTFLLAWAGPDFTHWPAVQAEYGLHTDLVAASGPGGFLRDYVARQPDFPTHLRAHPPGFVLGLWGAEQVGLSGRGFQLVLMLVAAAVAAVAVVIAVREVAGGRAARAAAPFVALAPAALWRTTPDGVFAAIAMSAIALIVLASGWTGRRSTIAAVTGGLVFAATLLCSYGLVLLAIPVAVVLVHRRAGRVALVTGAAAVAGLLVPYFWGFWWPAGFLETRVQYQASIARSRGYRYWLLGNAAIYASMIGPAVVAGLGRLRRGGLRLLVLGGLACPVLAGISGMSSAETERIWQPFVPLVLCAGAALWLRADGFDLRLGRAWLGLQAAVTVAFQVGLVSTW